MKFMENFILMFMLALGAVAHSGCTTDGNKDWEPLPDGKPPVIFPAEVE